MAKPTPVETKTKRVNRSSRTTVTAVKKQLAAKEADLAALGEVHAKSMEEAMAMMVELTAHNEALSAENVAKENLIQALISIYNDIKSEWEGKNGWERFWSSFKYIGRIFNLFQQAFTENDYEVK